MLNLEDWDVDLKDITDVEAMAQNGTAQLFQEQTRLD